MASAEEFVIRLSQQVAGPADTATAALNRLEAQIRKESEALSASEAALAAQGDTVTSLSSRLQSATDAWRTMAMESDKSKESEAAVKAQASAVMALQRQLDGASAAYEKLNAKAGAQGASLGVLNAAVPDLQALSTAAKAATAAEAALATAEKAKAEALKKANEAAKEAAHADKMLTQSEKLAAEDANAAANASLQGRIKGMAGAMENANGVTGKLTAALRSLGPVGSAIATALTVVIAVVGAVIIAFRDLAAAAISISQEKDALAATFKALSTGTESGRELVDSLSEVAAALPQAEGQVLAWGKALMSAGVEGEGLTNAVKAAASAAAIMNSGGAADAVVNMEKQLSEAGAAADAMMKVIQGGGKKAVNMLSSMGLQSHDLAMALGVTDEKFKTMKLTAEQMSGALEKALITKGAGALETMGLTWDSIRKKLGDGMEDLIEDFDTTALMSSVKSLFSEFFAGSTTMSTVKSVIVAVLTEVFSVATRVVNFIHRAFLQVEIAAFKVVAALWPIISILIAIGSNKTFIDGLVLSLKGIGIVLLIVVAAVGVMFVAINTVIAFFGAMVGVIITAVGAIVGALAWCVGDAARATSNFISTISTWPSAVWAAASAIASAAYSALDAMTSGGLTAAVNFVSGIVQGITSGVGSVVAAVKGLASSAMSAFTGFFKIHSPSQLMADTAIHIPGGIVEGVEAGTGDVEDAMTDMSGAGASAAKKGLAPGDASASGGGNVFHVNVEYSGAKEDFADFETKFMMLVEKLRGLAPRTT